MRSLLPRGLSGRLLTAIVPPVVLAVTAIVLLQYGMARRELLVAVDKEIALLAQQTASSIDELLEQRRRDLETLAESPLIADHYRNVDFQLLDEAEAYRRELLRYFQGFAARARVYSGILYADAAGRELCRVGPPGGAGEKEALRRGRKGRWESPLSEDARGRALYFARPVRDESGGLKGILLLRYDAEGLKEMLRRIAVSRRGRAYVDTPDGRLEAREAAAPEDERLAAAAPLSRGGWAVVVEAPLEDFLGPLRTVRNAALLTSLLGLAALVAILLLLVRTLTRPIAALADAARRIGAGDLSQRVPRAGEDELGALSGAFNEMAAGLEENRRQNTSLQAQLIQAEKLSAVGQLISAVAHELNNPLAAISGYVQVALQDKLPDGLRADLVSVYGNVGRCRKVVDNLLFFVRQSRHERKRVILNQAVESALELLEYRLVKTEDVRVVRALASTSPETAGDFQEIVQILLNLIGNACDAMESGPRRAEGKRLSIRTGESDGDAYIEVEDNGPGISEQARGRLFEPFYTTKEAGHGTGLGLSICRQIAQAHGGDVSVESSPGRGACFRLELPAGAPDDLDEPEEPRLEFAPVPGRRVLVADDEKDIAEIIARVLREDDDEVRVVHNGAEALALLSQESFDLVISDIEMERAKGQDIYGALLERAGGRAPSILFVTGDILNARVLEFLSRTKAEYLVKPFDVEELRSTIRRLLSER